MVIGDTYNPAMAKIRKALKGRGNRTVSVHKLFSNMAQTNQTFDVWHKKVSELAKTVDWTDYNYVKAAVEAIILQPSSGRLHQKALQENPTYKVLVKMGNSQEKAREKV